MYRLTIAFPWIVSIFSIIGLLYPPLITWFSGDLITLGLGGIMLGMGLTLNASDFLHVLKRPKWIIIGLCLQFIIMPFLGYSIAKAFELSPLFSVGIILVSSCPGGTASNVIAYLAKAEVALSVCMTACSTFLAVIITPFLTFQLSGNYLDIPAKGLFYSTLKVILLPISLGIIFNRYFPKLVSKIIPFAPPLAVFLICFFLVCIVGQGKDILFDSCF